MLNIIVGLSVDLLDSLSIARSKFAIVVSNGIRMPFFNNHIASQQLGHR
ncbi:hypothetical protein SAMN04488134_110101 [Amphibacillus marinus]|uniref:Uncharacterized protein n=1 Tax=Amphibacillus marinus TaxID=872970 RepID=A0A1H8RIM4_9BACI|nr:RAxF-45 family protein [Amphibacillus marinus]SEO66172.1 hypothetical protein SAMN04488134_110101 [Amphibacillus marinus]